MSALLDTSFVVRYLTGDQPELATRAADVINSDEPRSVSEGILMETAFVLGSVYRIPRPAIIDQTDEKRVYSFDRRFPPNGIDLRQSRG